MRLRIKLPTENSWLNITGKIVKCESAPIGHYWAHIKLSALGPMEKKYIRTYLAWILVKEGINS